ncbi:hypothetical protein [Hydrogenimonas sp.]
MADQNDKYVVELESEADYIEFMKTKFENAIKKIEKAEKRYKEKIAQLKNEKEEIEKEFKEFKKKHPQFFRRGRKPKNA